MNLAHGTDPIEGSSLAISILEAFFNKGLLTMSTTHYPEIKNYALTHDGFENASSDFDLENLKPTYKFLIGIPGKSNAFAISKKLGLDQAIIDRASTFINSDSISIEELLKNIYDDKLKLEKEKEEIEKNLAQAELLRKSFETKNNNLAEKETSIIENAKIEARKILLDAKDKVSSTIQEINKAYKNADDSIVKNLNNRRNLLTDAIKGTASIVETKNNVPSVSKDDLQLGMKVFVTNFNQNGIITNLPNQSNEVQVQIGSMKTMVSLSNIVKTNDSNIEKGTTISSTSSYKTNKSRNATTEINVIGYNVEEAIFTIDKYLDDSALAKLKTVRIVHGKGTGALRKGIHAFLKTNSHVKSFRLGTYGEGEMGVTVVELK